jgi:hypothetical protein
VVGDDSDVRRRLRSRRSPPERAARKGLAVPCAWSWTPRSCSSRSPSRPCCGGRGSSGATSCGLGVRRPTGRRGPRVRRWRVDDHDFT